MTCSACDPCPLSVADRSAPAYELHVTVQTRNLNNFSWACSVLGLKPLVIDIYDTSGDQATQQVMTSSTVTGDWRGPLNAAVRGLRLASLQVVRQKVEAAPWCPEVPTLANGRRADLSEYLEGHVLLDTDKGMGYEVVRGLCRFHGYHLSSSPRKPGHYYATRRCGSSVLEEFEAQQARFCAVVGAYSGLRVAKQFTEFTVMDTARDVDGDWGR